MKRDIVFVTGYFGAPIKKLAEDTAAARGRALLYLDDEIEKADGRSVKRICMTMGEHEYRNKEYEALLRITGGADDTSNGAKNCEADGAESLVVCCGDGVLLDEMSAALIKRYPLLIAGRGITADELWDGAKKMTDTCHAFMYFGTEDERHAAFLSLYERQRELFAGYDA